jgi:hypothetical protein
MMVRDTERNETRELIRKCAAVAMTTADQLGEPAIGRYIRDKILLIADEIEAGSGAIK